MSEFDGFTARQTNQCPGGTAYVIKAGDTLFVIAARYNITVNSILNANPGLDPNNLQIGRTICLPVAPTEGGTCPGGTLYSIKAGDTLYQIAKRYGVSLQSLINANPGIDPRMLNIGQLICVPTQPAPSPPPSPAPGLALPCSSVLKPAGANIPLSAAGSALIAQLSSTQAMAQPGYSVTFTGANLPSLESLGDFNSYIGTITFRSVPATEQGPVKYSAILGSTALSGQPVTWSGTRAITERPTSQEYVEIRAAKLNVETGPDVMGPIIVNGTLSSCGS